MASIKELKARSAARKAAQAQPLKTGSISFFYKSTPGGPGMEVHCGELAYDSALLKAYPGSKQPIEIGLQAISDENIAAYDECFKDDADQAAYCFEQLEGIISNNRNGGCDISEIIIFCMNVAWLTARGHLKNDNWNGLLIVDSTGMKQNIVTEEELEASEEAARTAGTKCEHDRRGHFVISKLGKKFWRRGSTINKSA